MLISCIEIEDSIWQEKSAYIVFSVITPNHPVQVYVNKTHSSINSENSEIITNAEVYIRRENTNWELLSAKTVNIYIDKDTVIKVETGKTYQLKVVIKTDTMFAQTTVPNEIGRITHVECIFPDNSHYDQDFKPTNLLGNLKANYSLPKNNDTGCLLSAFSQLLNQDQFLTGTYLLDEYFLCPFDSTSFTLSLITVDENLRRFQIAKNINGLQNLSDNFLSIILGSYGGVLPVYSNIKNGIGLFGSFVSDNKRVISEIKTIK